MKIRPRIWLPLTAVLAVCVSAPVTLWFTEIAEFNNLPDCPKSIDAEPVAMEPFTDIADPADQTTPEFGHVLTVAGLTMMSYDDLAYDTISDPGTSSDGKNITRLINADRSGYQEVAAPKVMDYSVAPDLKRAAVLEDVGGSNSTEASPRLGIQDLRTGSLDWLPLTQPARLAAWSPTDDVVLVAPDDKPGELFLVDVATGKVETITLAAPLGNRILTSILWKPTGESFIATAATSKDSWASAEVKLDGSAHQLPVPVSGIGLSPSGTKSAVYFEDSPWIEIVDVESGKPVTAPGFDGCSSEGNVHEFIPQAWIDDNRLIAIESDNAWEMDKRWGEPGHEPLGNRLVIVDLDGAVHEAITEWGAVLPATMHFARDTQKPPTDDPSTEKND